MAFMLLLCLTGLPLIFHAEIDELTRAREIAEEASVGGRANINEIVAKTRAQAPEGWEVIFLTWDDEAPLINAIIGPSMDSSEGEVKILPFDSRTGEMLDAPPQNEGIMYFLLDLHASLLLGLPGTLFMGFMGLVFLVSLISGVVVYTPFMRKLPFGTVRKDKGARVKRIDTHNMVSMVSLGWLTVVGFTGIVITMATPIQMIWQAGQLSDLSAGYEGQSPPKELIEPQTAFEVVEERFPEAEFYFISWPGSPMSTPHHYLISIKGNTPLTERLLQVALVDAQTGKITAVEDTPWYLKVLNLSVPLHFGDYGGLLLKIIWAILDTAAIVVLWTGLRLWWRGRKIPVAKHIAQLGPEPDRAPMQ